MKAITEGMTPVEFISAINANFIQSGFYGSTINYITATSDTIDVFNNNFSSIKDNAPVSLVPKTFNAGMKAVDYANNLIDNFNQCRLKVPVPALTIKCDDQYGDNLASTWYPLLSGLGLKADMSVVPANVGVAGFLSWADLITLKNAGWCITCHARNWTDDYVTMSDVDVITALTEARDTIIAQGFICDIYGSHAYAYRRPNLPTLARTIFKMSESKTMFADYKDTPPYYGINPVELNPFYIGVITFDGNNEGGIGSQYDLSTDAGLVLFKALIDSVIISNTWLIIIFHGKGNVAFNARVADLLNYAIASGISIKTSEEVYNSLVSI